jgi:hypothetical protein
MIAVLDIFQMSPDFKAAVVAVHGATTPVALVVCFAGLRNQWGRFCLP